MAGTTGQISGDVIDAIRPDLEAFASLWSALRTNYQGTNITKTVARLLHMYQPEDGVLAYERLLRTLYVLLEDFDGDGLRLLVSMVPPPKGVPDEVIREVFHKATGFVRLNAPIFHKNNATSSESDVNSSSSTKTGDVSSDSRPIISNAGTPRLQTILSNAENAPEGTTILRAIVKSDLPVKSSKSPKLSKIRPRESEAFYGFPSNEITNTQSHARNMTNFYGPSTNYGGYPQSQRYVDYRQVQGQGAGSIPPRGIDPSAYRLKWLEAPMLARKNNYEASTGYPDLILKTSDNKYIRLPMTKINGPPMGNFNTPIQTAYQAYYPNNQIHLRSNDFNSESNNSDLSRKMPNHLRSKKSFENDEKPDELINGKEKNLENSRISHVDHDYGFTRADNCSAEKENFEIGNLGSPNNETIDKFRDTVKNSQRAIQEDIYRMDVVRCDEDIVQNSTEDLNNLDTEILFVTEELKKGACDFLKRAEEEISLNSPPFPKTRMLQDPENYPPLRLKASPRVWKHERLSKYRQKLEKIEDSTENCGEETVDSFCSENPNLSSTISTPVNSFTSKGSRVKGGRNQATSKSEKAFQKNSNSSRNSSSRNCIQNSPFVTNEDNTSQNTASSMESVNRRNETMQQPNSVSELVNYRKQYYDALLSIQRAKVAVANSLAMSSSGTATSYDPRVFQYLQQQHQLLQQQQRILMGSQHPVARQAIVQPGFSNIRSTAGLWIRGSSDWKYSPCGQYAFPRQSYPMSSSSSCPAQAPIDTATDTSISGNFPRASHNSHRTVRPAVKRRKLEDIVGKLKNTDD